MGTTHSLEQLFSVEQGRQTLSCLTRDLQQARPILAWETRGTHRATGLVTREELPGRLYTRSLYLHLSPLRRRRRRRRGAPRWSKKWKHKDDFFKSDPTL